MVISREAFLAGEDTRVMEEIVRVKEVCGDAHLKVILETAELGSYDHVRHASMLAMEAGADFIKTSTGKAASGATPGVTLVMLEAIRDYAERSGRAVGMKAAGGVSTSKAPCTGWCSSRRRSATSGLRRIAFASVPRRCSTTCSCSTRRPRPGAMPDRRTSRRNEHPGGPHQDRLGLRASPGVARARSPARLLRPLHRRGVPRPARRPARAHDQPGDRGDGRRGRVRRRGRPARGGGVRTRGPARLGGAVGPRARQVPLPRRAPDPGARPRARGGGIDGRRQADPRVARRGRPARGRALLLLRGLGGQALLRRRWARGRAARRGRADRPLELPVVDGGLEARPGPGVRQHRDAQAGGDHAAERAALGRDLPGGRAAARRCLDRAGRWRGRRGARAPAGDRQGRVHGLHRRGQGHPGGARRARRLAHARARR